VRRDRSGALAEQVAVPATSFHALSDVGGTVAGDRPEAAGPGRIAVMKRMPVYEHDVTAVQAAIGVSGVTWMDRHSHTCTVT
jgi:hypothetical protein